MSRTTRLWLLVAPAAVAIGATASALMYFSDHQDVPRLQAVFTALIGGSFIAAGLIARTRRPLNRTGLLMNQEAGGDGAQREADRPGQRLFAAFILSADRVSKEFGLLLAIAILTDALIIRMTLVPAFLTMLGEKAWYMPRWLDRLLPGITIEPPQDGEAPPRFTEHPVQVPSRP